MSSNYVASNNSVSTVGANFNATATAITVATGHGARFPSPTAGDYTLATLETLAGIREIVCIVGRSGDVLTVGIPGSAAANVAGRNYEAIYGMSAASWVIGDTIECRPTAALVGALLNGVTPTNTVTLTNKIVDAVDASLVAVDKTVFAATIVDAFLYNTEKDSDGGAWRKRCAHTSWEAETLSGNWLGSAANETAARAISGATTGSYYYDTTAAAFYTLNAGSGKTITYRGNVRQFPAKVLITVELNRLVLWDLTQAGAPMWMVFAFPVYTTGANFINTPYGLCANTSYVTANLTGVSAVNGRMFIAASSSATCGWDTSFLTESSYWHVLYPTNGTLTLRQKLFGNISQRNSTTGVSTGDKYGSTSSDGIKGVSNDVAMTVLPNAPVDVATGLPVPTIAVATAGGVSVIKDDGNVWDITYGGHIHKAVSFDANNRIHATLNAYPEHYSIAIPSADNTANPPTGSNVFGSATIPAIFTDVAKRVSSRGDVSGASGVAMLVENVATRASSMVAYVTKDYNSGWMPGDIRGAWLADTVAETLTGTELVTNGTFATDTTGWTGIGCTIASVAGGESGNCLELTRTISSPYAWCNITGLVTGKIYVMTAAVKSGTSGNEAFNLASETVNDGGGGTVTPGTSSAAWVKASHYFVATATSMSLYVQKNATGAGTMLFDTVTCRLADVDRSVKAKGLQAFGSLTKAAVASGATLMGYSGFSAANYLEQPYNSDLDFGTGDFYVMGWLKETPNTGGEIIFCRGKYSGSWSGSVIQTSITAAGLLNFYVSDDSTVTGDTVTGATAIDDSTPRLLVFGRNGSNFQIWMNDGSAAHATVAVSNAAASLSNIGATLMFGLQQPLTSPLTSGTFALWRAGAGFPSAEQIKHIYETERPMFEAGAQCCLAGTSNAITALAYDDETDLLHVGTSYGRSAFKGLVRVSSEATPVGAITALAASAGVVVQGGATAVDVYVPAYTLREELLRDAEQMAKFGQNLVAHDFTATSSQTTFTLPVGWEIVAVYQQGAIKRETTSWSRSFDGFKWSAVLGTGATVSDWISILAKRV